MKKREISGPISSFYAPNVASSSTSLITKDDLKRFNEKVVGMPLTLQHHHPMQNKGVGPHITVGKIEKAWIDQSDDSLHINACIDDSARGERAWQEINNKFLRGFSCGIENNLITSTDPNVPLLNEKNLIEVSIVAVPEFPNATFTNIREIQAFSSGVVPPEIAERSEKLLKDILALPEKGLTWKEVPVEKTVSTNDMKQSPQVNSKDAQTMTSVAQNLPKPEEASLAPPSSTPQTLAQQAPTQSQWNAPPTQQPPAPWNAQTQQPPQWNASNQQPPQWTAPPTQQPPQGQWNAPPTQQPPQGQWNAPPTQQPPQGQWNAPPTQQPPQSQWNAPPTQQPWNAPPPQQQWNAGPNQPPWSAPPAQNQPPQGQWGAPWNAPPTQWGAWNAPPPSQWNNQPQPPVAAAPTGAPATPAVQAPVAAAAAPKMALDETTESRKRSAPDVSDSRKKATKLQSVQEKLEVLEKRVIPGLGLDDDVDTEQLLLTHNPQVASLKQRTEECQRIWDEFENAKQQLDILARDESRLDEANAMAQKRNELELEYNTKAHALLTDSQKAVSNSYIADGKRPPESIQRQYAKWANTPRVRPSELEHSMSYVTLVSASSAQTPNTFAQVQKDLMALREDNELLRMKNANEEEIARKKRGIEFASNSADRFDPKSRNEAIATHKSAVKNDVAQQIAANVKQDEKVAKENRYLGYDPETLRPIGKKIEDFTYAEQTGVPFEPVDEKEPVHERAKRLGFESAYQQPKITDNIKKLSFIESGLNGLCLGGMFRTGNTEFNNDVLSVVNNKLPKLIVHDAAFSSRPMTDSKRPKVTHDGIEFYVVG
jgi:hypothetical protein